MCLEWITASGVKKKNCIQSHVSQNTLAKLQLQECSLFHGEGHGEGWGEGGVGGEGAIGFNCATHLFDYIHVN